MKLSEQKQKKFINEIIRYFEEEKDETIGIIQAQNFLDFILKEIGPEIYNEAVYNSQKIISDNLEELQFKLEEIKK